MGILPVLLVIIAIASVVANYNKIAKQRLEDQKKRMEAKRNEKTDSVTEKSEKSYTPMSVGEPMLSRAPIQKNIVSARQTVKPRVSVKNMQNAVIMAEILNKPVSLREK